VIVQSLQQYGITLSLDICTRYNISLSITCTSQLVLLVPISGNRRIEKKPGSILGISRAFPKGKSMTEPDALAIEEERSTSPTQFCLMSRGVPTPC
jgi:hypothetical protein